jgi:hypothetical protein
VGVVVCDIVEIVVESAASHREMVRPRENGAAISRLGADDGGQRVMGITRSSRTHDADS